MKHNYIITGGGVEGAGVDPLTYEIGAFFLKSLKLKSVSFKKIL